MNTFLPVRDYQRSAQILDWRRLGKQRVEAYSIMRILLNHVDGGNYKNHPAVNMWRGYEYSLDIYGWYMCEEWRNRGYKDNLLQRFVDFHEELKLLGLPNKGDPWWLGNRELHLSHRSNLLRKDFNYYYKFPEFKGVVDSVGYWWPTKNNKEYLNA